MPQNGNNNEIKFTTLEKISMGLPLGVAFYDDEPETVALRKILDTFPFMQEVAHHHFDPRISKQILKREADKIVKEQQLELLAQAGT